MLKFLIFFGIVPLGFVLGLSSASMATIYTIAPHGDDEAACTAQAACASIRRVSDLLVAGDTLDVQAAVENAWLQQVMRQAARELGQMRGGLLQNTGDEQPLGFLRLAMTWSTTLRPQFPSVAKAMPNLADALKRATAISAFVDRHLYIGSPDFERSPFVFITSERAFELTKAEAEALGRHLKTGGFLFVDSAEGNLEFSQAEAALRHMFRQALGRRAQLRRIADHHPIYHAPYEFNGPPPGLNLQPNAARIHPQHSLDGLFIESRLVALFSDRGYVHLLAQSNGNEPQMRLFINAVHYALRNSPKATTIVLRRVDPPQ
ncbi:MAG: DUF4159 domain-containing protein [Gemmatimonadetes bacterium]|jgi:hypothetical protein|nr:DUF4159 domain-containing protein [Gemmatimonadota bacterium]MBT4610532.1 DUF4159 domain-containing protein [Gemmatimonadota bacterium]MBT5059591.1 DUF4159 domain-containing protein [Gemmatimonadota bacterium]MBT5144662.1 DUF4159 domain-containing protein [Gemmatimonadota bacterium]MBT5587377.1 DUF4159 domain-containing protein [Gemmatimonadota bacterium]